MENKRVKLGVYDFDDNFYGYKIDSFWSLSKKGGYKEHTLNNESIIPNLLHILNDRLITNGLNEVKNILDTCCEHVKEKDYNVLINKGGLIVKYFDLETLEVVKILKIVKRDNRFEMQVNTVMHLDETIEEICPHCDTVNKIMNPEFKMCECNNCHRPLKPCSLCDMDKVDCNNCTLRKEGK